MKRYRYKSKFYTAMQLADIREVSLTTMNRRLKKYKPQEAVEGGRYRLDNGHAVKLYKYNGEKMTAKQIAADLGITVEAFYSRMKRGNLIPKRPKNVLYEYKGQMLTINQLAEIAGVKPSTFSQRLKNNSVADAVAMKYRKQQYRKRPVHNDFEGYDPDLELKRRIESYRAQGWTDEEILEKVRVAA